MPHFQSYRNAGSSALASRSSYSEVFWFHGAQWPKNRVQKIQTQQWASLAIKRHSSIQRLCSAKPYPLSCVPRRELAAGVGQGRGVQLAWNSGFVLLPSTIPYVRPTPGAPCPQVRGNEQCTATTAPSGLSRSVKCTQLPSSRSLLCSSPVRMAFLCAVATLHPQVCNDPF